MRKEFYSSEYVINLPPDRNTTDIDDAKFEAALDTFIQTIEASPYIEQPLKKFVFQIQGELLEYKDGGTTLAHSLNVAHYNKLFAEVMGFNEKLQEEAYVAGFLHDMGKLHVNPDHITKPNMLTLDEWGEMKEHPELGVRRIEQETTLMYDHSPFVQGILDHHEEWDGTGYPLQKSGKEISLMGRILAIVDQYDAMTMERAHTSDISRTHARAATSIEGLFGTKFDPDLKEPYLLWEQRIRGAYHASQLPGKHTHIK